MATVSTEGLMTFADRKAAGINARLTGQVFGDGVYVGNNPFAFSNM